MLNDNISMKERATLYSRLGAKHLEKLVEQRQKFPNMVAEAERAMNENVWVISLTVGEMCTICDVLEIDWNNIFLIFEYE
jgi:hypothetical protein